MAVTRGKTYPRFGTNIWWELRDAFQKERPEAVDVPYLIGRLGQSEKSARNLLPNFRALGLIDESGRPTELADLWRSDATYGCALDEMVHRAYPEVADQFPTPPEDRSALENWFAATTGTGENSVRQMASFYLLLSAKDALATGEQAENVPFNGVASVGESSHSEPNPTPSENPSVVSVRTESVVDMVPNDTSSASRADTPVIHLHLHFTPDTSETQVEALMRSVRKYL